MYYVYESMKDQIPRMCVHACVRTCVRACVRACV